MPCNFQEYIAVKAKKRKDQLIKNIDDSLNGLKHYTTQIFSFNDEKLEQVGSGFYLRHNEGIFLISAAHVFDDKPENIRYIFDETGSLEQITGTFYKHISSTKRDDDLKDIIAIELNKPPTNNIIDSSMIDLGSYYQNGFYAFIGYPGTKNGVIFKRREMKNHPYSYYDRSLKAENIDAFSYDDNLNILIRYQHQRIITNGTGPNIGTRMKGISGGPVFWVTSISDLSNWTNERIKLSGVVIHTVERHQYMAAVRLKVLIECLDNLKKCSDFDTFQVHCNES
jgi:hypothetical protein